VAKKGQLWPVGLHLLIGLGVWPLHMLQQIGEGDCPVSQVN